MKSVLFLDIDGVLNSLEYAKRLRKEKIQVGIYGFDPIAVRHLTRVFKRTKCDVVISSTWRKSHSVEEIRNLLVEAGMPETNANQVIALNPIAYDYSFTPEYHAAQNLAFATAPWPARWYRGYESAVWLSRNAGYTGVAIVDDDRDMWHLAENFVHTTWKRGLTSRKGEELVRMLRKDSTQLISRLKTLVYQEHL